MTLKDYYSILGVTPVATQQEIKKSFRKLAVQYHPDKNEGDHLSAARFVEIQEAYEVLSDPQRREEYNYNRWYARQTKTGFSSKPLAPEEILASAAQLKDAVKSMNHFQVDFNSLSFHILQLLNETNLSILLQINKTGANRDIIKNLLQAAGPLPLKEFIPVYDQLLVLAGDEEEMKLQLQQELRLKEQRHRWDRYKWILVVLIIAFVCWLMTAVAG